MGPEKKSRNTVSGLFAVERAKTYQCVQSRSCPVRTQSGMVALQVSATRIPVETFEARHEGLATNTSAELLLLQRSETTVRCQLHRRRDQDRF